MERPAFDRLLAATLPTLERMAQAYAARYYLHHEWRDIAQSALLKMLRFADYYDRRKGEFMPWASVIIINTIKSRIAQIAAAPYKREIDDYVTNRTRSEDSPETDLQTSLIIDNLNEDARLYVEGYNYSEIAALRGLRSKSAVKDRIDKSADRLRRLLGIKAERGKRERTYAKNPA